MGSVSKRVEGIKVVASEEFTTLKTEEEKVRLGKNWLGKELYPFFPSSLSIGYNLGV